jgi:Arc/MetJ-type ribon-helix-helix transcriptional regulator
MFILLPSKSPLVVIYMKLITIYLPEPYLDALDELVNKRLYPHRAEAIRAAIRDLIEVELWGRKGHGKASR